MHVQSCLFCLLNLLFFAFICLFFDVLVAVASLDLKDPIQEVVVYLKFTLT